jgi:hypothetical protein
MGQFYGPPNPAIGPFDALVNPQVAAIVEALMSLGGSAHRDEVCHKIAQDRGLQQASDAMKSDLFAAFESHRSFAKTNNLRALLDVPFGPGSRRWSLTLEAYQFFRKAVVAHRMLN